MFATKFKLEKNKAALNGFVWQTLSTLKLLLLFSGFSNQELLKITASITSDLRVSSQANSLVHAAALATSATNFDPFFRKTSTYLASSYFSLVCQHFQMIRIHL